MSLTNEQKQELAELNSSSFQTKRATVPALEEVLYNPIKILDHGFVRVIDYMGDDNAIVQAARVSYGKGTKKVNQDKGLINYLMRHWHTTPFEMCEIKFHIKLPIFVARQWIRHRTANVNEYSARYSIMDKEFYIPELSQLAPQSKQNHQGRAENDPLTGAEAARVLEILKNDSELTYSHYEELMNEDREGNVLNPEKRGLARELARMNLTVNYYTQWYWKVDLHNLFHFLMLRADPHAQYEIRAYADAMLEVVKKWVPFAYDAFMEYRMHSAHLSKTGLDVVKRMLKGEKVTQENSGLTTREWEELQAKLG
jgi:thymidylate synthase (FAD)